MITIKIDKQIINAAIEHSKKRMNYEFNRFEQNDQFRFNMILVGTIGELAFKKFLDSRNIKYKMEFQAGEYDLFDFVINDKIFEIKTSGYEGSNFNNLNLLYNYGQYINPKRKNYNYVIQIFINGYDRSGKALKTEECNTATIAGYIKYNEIINHPLTNNKYYKNYKVNLINLSSINKIIKG